MRNMVLVGRVASMTLTRENTETIMAREYLRVSRDRSGVQRSPKEQHQDNARQAQTRGWKLGEAYQDIGSASRYATRAREDFARLVADLKADTFGAQILILWESSRGSRKVSEWVALIELCELRGASIFVTSDGKLYDPSDARDRRSLLEDSVDAEYETAKTSKRSRRAHAATAAAGKPSGPVAYGYRREYDPETKRLVAQMEDRDEGKVVRELFKRLHSGDSLRAITLDFERRGIRTRRGKPFNAQTLRLMALSPTYAGQRVHDTTRKYGAPTANAVLTDAVWPALVGRDVFLTVQRRLTAPERVTMRPGRGIHLLSGIARCDVCGGVLTARTRKPAGVEYQCPAKGCVRVEYHALNTLAESVMLEWLARPDVVDTSDPTGTDDELQAVRDEVAEIQKELDDLADQVGRGDLSASLAARAEPAIAARLKDAQARERELSTPSDLRGLIEPGEDVALRWEVALMSTRRDVARLLLAPDSLGELRVTRTLKPGVSCPVQDRIVWRTDD